MREPQGCTQDKTLQHEHKIHDAESEYGQIRSILSPDKALCSFCQEELFNPDSPYYYYPFLHCQQCGPGLPISHCALNIPIKEITLSLLNGKILAIKGVSSWQLFCDAKNDHAIQLLRQKKNRKAKPFVVMVANSASAKSYVEMSHEEQMLLESPARPIVLLKKNNTLPQSIAPQLSHLGIMLPSTALHYLLFHALIGSPDGESWLTSTHSPALIVSSMLTIDEEEVTHELSLLADQVVLHPHHLRTHIGESMMQLVNNKPVFIRRARGFVPEPIQLPTPIPSTLALGGHYNNTFCITRDDEAFVSQYIGNLNNKNAIAFFHESLSYWTSFLNIKIERLACDSHPDYYTTRHAQTCNLPLTSVPHHHAHLASVAAEHHILRPALGLTLDGYGVNSDARGGELLLLHKSNFQRISNFFPIPLPGSNLSSQEPWQAAAGILELLGMNYKIAERFSTMPLAALLANMLKLNTPVTMTSSCGTLFDAASALLGVNLLSDFDGQAMMQLQSLVTQLEILPNGWSFNNNQFNLLPTFRYLLDTDAAHGANIFHGTLVAGLSEWIAYWANKLSTTDILLSGECFLNKVLGEGLQKELAQKGLNVFIPQRLPPDDAGLSLGQAWIAGIR